MNNEIYLDGNATTCILPAAALAAADIMAERYGNPSSSHGTGLRAKVVLDQARQCAVRLLGAGEGRLMFNSGATEGIQTAVLSALVAVRERQVRGESVGSLLVYGATEHKAVPEALAHWNRLLGTNLKLTALPVDGGGLHDLAALRALAPDAAMICTMAANNETGVVSDLDGIAAAIEASGTTALWMVDCVQALGKLQLNLASTRIDYAPFSGHKLHAPKGVGMLYVRAGAPFTPLVMGGGQETGQRSGTENMAGIAALGVVLAALERGDTFPSHAQLHGYRARLADALRAALPGVVFNNAFEKSLPTTLNFAVPGVSSRELMDVFDAARVRVSAGSACSASKAAPSYVLDAMGLPLWRSAGAIRMSFGAMVDEATIATACQRIAHCGAALRAAGMIADQPSAEPDDGLLQLGVEGECGWLVLDAASRSCIVIDPLPPLTARITAIVRGHNYRVLAIVATTAGADHAPLVKSLGAHYDAEALTDAFGWPAITAHRLTLADGAEVNAIAIGGQVLAQVAAGEGARAYLLGVKDGVHLPADLVRFAFTAHAESQVAAVTTEQTLLCPTRDARNQLCAGHADVACAADLQLDSHALDAFLQAHPDAMLVDVREPYEFAATIAATAGARAAQSVPLSRLVEHASLWLRGGTHQPLVFVCRSGNRSMKAAQCLRRLGHASSYSLTGGLALAA
ncbi:cysteine sulfinate desulfinase/cysteine desulfurase-like protein/rhodanese-related sulfurtransferase [Duganella sp. 3397]|uniref:aminotransferase class V-fold PLP-dependent enzyme n=1 Tax=Duganella sp. 3397 TaxID=2817732 RepID=UPI002865F770|nr:aminotransferase class V-fold PLP-dependent enzyme [Duganella sp. 3397]MDR7048131.1 cysteine sulfinate desulfinase/cysteine desulfurase-like protein/rhodanese-related sulfurtransferase [Duganella sp. 3397]